MSHVTHRAMCITCFDKDKLFLCREKIKALGLPTTEIIQSEVNVYYTFFTAPCGSKAGWDDEAKHLASLSKATDIIKEFEYEDGSNPIHYTIAEYGEFEG